MWCAGRTAVTCNGPTYIAQIGVIMELPSTIPNLSLHDEAFPNHRRGLKQAGRAMD
jgi:hypothetical protein